MDQSSRPCCQIDSSFMRIRRCSVNRYSMGRLARGAATVELALVAPILILLMMGIFEISYSIHSYRVLEDAVRQAARHAAQNYPLDSVDLADVKCMAAYGSVSAGSGNSSCEISTPLLGGLTVGSVAVCDPVSCAITNKNQKTGNSSDVVNFVSVKISGYVYRSPLGYVLPTVINFNDISASVRVL